jgi:hypothetical protein
VKCSFSNIELVLTSIFLCVGGTCPTCRRDPVQTESIVSVGRPLAAEPAQDGHTAQAAELERPSMGPVRSWESDSDGRQSTEAEAPPLAGNREPATLNRSQGPGEDIPVENTARERNNSSAVADENSVLVWSP